MDVLGTMREMHRSFSIRLYQAPGKLFIMNQGGPVLVLTETGHMSLQRPETVLEFKKACEKVGTDVFIAVDPVTRYPGRICLLNRPCSSRCGIMISSQDGQFFIRPVHNWTRDGEAYLMIAGKPLS